MEAVAIPTRKPVFTILSVIIFCAALIVAIYLPLNIPEGVMGANAFGYLVLGIAVFCLSSILSLSLAIIGLRRRERLRWLAITCIVFSVLPALEGISIVFSWHWSN